MNFFKSLLIGLFLLSVSSTSLHASQLEELLELYPSADPTAVEKFDKWMTNVSNSNSSYGKYLVGTVLLSFWVNKVRDEDALNVTYIMAASLLKEAADNGRTDAAKSLSSLLTLMEPD